MEGRVYQSKFLSLWYTFRLSFSDRRWEKKVHQGVNQILAIHLQKNIKETVIFCENIHLKKNANWSHQR